MQGEGMKGGGRRVKVGLFNDAIVIKKSIVW